jgi:hypothetical protein|nr:MAG TPA: HTH-type transcriptional regulator [Caudoviricetes sp.]
MKERVLQFIEYTGLNKASFEKMVGLSNGAVDKMGANTRHSTVDKISKTFPEINRDWLMTGKGNMLNEGASNNGVVEISAEAWNVIKKQADSLASKDRQVEELISILKKANVRADDNAVSVGVG